MKRYRLSPRVLSFLEGSSIYQSSPGADPGADELRAALDDGHRSWNMDGSRSVVLSDDHARRIRRYIEGMEMGGRDNAWDPDGRADMNSARALLRKLPA
jgi:hypothetical protein